MTGIVYKIMADKFWVKSNNLTLCCTAKKILKNDNIFVGDNVEFNEEEKNITKVLQRKCLLIRPPLANIDKLIIVITCVPKPDYLMLDKLILFALSYGIKPAIVVNKTDLGNEVNEYIKKVYTNVVDKVFSTNTISGDGVYSLKEYMKNSLCAFAGQSAVGKSALINKLMKNYSSKVGELSKKNQKGKNTTRHCEIFFDDNIMIVDTAGFNSLDEKLLNIAYYELPYYYKDFLGYLEKCKYKSCAHYNEKVQDCAVKNAVINNKIDKNRFLRYKEIYKNLYEKWVKTHG